MGENSPSIDPCEGTATAFLFIMNPHVTFLLCHCRRNRAIQEGTSPYAILPDSVVFDSDAVRANIINSKNNVTLALTIETLQRNTARIRIQELNPIRPRYECKDSLVKPPTRVRFVKF